MFIKAYNYTDKKLSLKIFLQTENKLKTTKEIKITVFIIILCVLVIMSVFGWRYYMNWKEENQIRNVFDEIFYVESSYITYNSFTQNIVRSVDPFGELESIDNIGRGAPYNSDLGFTYLDIHYKSESLSEDINALFYKYDYKMKKHKVDKMIIGMVRNLSDNPEITASLFLIYDPEKNYFRREMRVNSEPSEGMQETEKSLQKYGLTIEEMESWSEDILKNRIVKDWLSVYDSTFTTEDMGEFCVQTEWD